MLLAGTPDAAALSNTALRASHALRYAASTFSAAHRLWAKGMEAMDRSLSLVWSGKVADSRAPVRRALIRLRRVLGGDSSAPPSA